MKRKIYIVLGLVVLCGLAVAWFGRRPPSRFVGGFSTEDFKEVQKIIRQTMWQRAFPGFSAKTLATFPGSLWRLATSRIEQVDVFPGGTACVVLVRTPVGIELFDVQKSARKPRWQIKSQGSAGQGLIKRIESIGGFAKFTVKRDIGLIGGELPAVFYTPAVYPYPESFHLDPFPAKAQGLGLGSNQVSLSFDTRSGSLDDGSQPRATKHDVILSEGQFSGSLSNGAKLELRP